MSSPNQDLSIVEGAKNLAHWRDQEETTQSTAKKSDSQRISWSQIFKIITAQRVWKVAFKDSNGIGSFIKPKRQYDCTTIDTFCQLTRLMRKSIEHYSKRSLHQPYQIKQKANREIPNYPKIKDSLKVSHLSSCQAYFLAYSKMLKLQNLKLNSSLIFRLHIVWK